MVAVRPGNKSWVAVALHCISYKLCFHIRKHSMCGDRVPNPNPYP